MLQKFGRRGLAFICLLGVTSVFAEDINWRRNPKAALDEAKKAKTIVMIDVYTDWCGWCTKLDEETYSDPIVADLLSKIIPVKLNPEESDANARFIKPYNVTGYPNILFVNSSGKLLDRIDGFKDAAGFAKELKRIYKANKVALSDQAGGAPAKGIVWLTDFTKAAALAKSQNKLIMMDVFTDWCGWCVKLDEETYTAAEVIQLSGNFINVKLDGDNNPRAEELTAKYNITGYPTILFLEPDGTVANRIGGYVDAAQFAVKLRQVMEFREGIKTYAAEYHSGDYRHLPELLSMLFDLERVDEAKPIFDSFGVDAGISAESREKYALSIATYLLDLSEYAAALPYINIAEAASTATENTYQAHYLHAIVNYFISGKDEAEKYLNAYIDSTTIPPDWLSQYRDLRDEIKAIE